MRLNVGLKRASLSIGGRGFTYKLDQRGPELSLHPWFGALVLDNVTQNPIGRWLLGRRLPVRVRRCRLSPRPPLHLISFDKQ